jgi:hypothetical protein
MAVPPWLLLGPFTLKTDKDGMCLVEVNLSLKLGLLLLPLLDQLCILNWKFRFLSLGWG